MICSLFSAADDPINNGILDGADDKAFSRRRSDGGEAHGCVRCAYPCIQVYPNLFQSATPEVDNEIDAEAKSETTAESSEEDEWESRPFAQRPSLPWWLPCPSAKRSHERKREMLSHGENYECE